MSASPLPELQGSLAEAAPRYEDGLIPANQPQPIQPHAVDKSPLMVTTLEMGPQGGKRRSKRFWIVLALICIVVVGVAVGVGVGVGVKKSKPNHEGSQTSSSSASQTSSLTSSVSPTSSLTSSPSPTASLTILSAVYGRADVTAEAISKLRQGDNIVINFDDLPFSDNWYVSSRLLSHTHDYYLYDKVSLIPKSGPNRTPTCRVNCSKTHR